MSKIKSRNSLFKGQLVAKPAKALVVRYDPEAGPVYQCPKCKHEHDGDWCDVIGAEPGCAFCPECSTEFEL